MSNGIEKLNKGLQDIFKLMAARNKVLWENGTGWSSGSITVPDVDKYNEFDVYLWTTTSPVRCCLIDGRIVGANMLPNVSPNKHTSAAISLVISGTTLTFQGAGTIQHLPSGSHMTLDTQSIRKIVGVEPIPAKILSGALLNRLFAPLMRLDRGCVAW